MSWIRPPIVNHRRFLGQVPAGMASQMVVLMQQSQVVIELPVEVADHAGPASTPSLRTAGKILQRQTIGLGAPSSLGLQVVPPGPRAYWCTPEVTISSWLTVPNQASRVCRIFLRPITPNLSQTCFTHYAHCCNPHLRKKTNVDEISAILC